ncbi:PadR family transcriptional regulator [Halorientalis sp.]|uniref:PadR family transcriptional regulator n=1 Tax=Halorientalis sp. TaxID=1931229 RepID=UPI002638FEEF|nr:PadR family transcriptional regulator [Halorientalis sp.]
MDNLTAFQRDVLYALAGLDEAYGLAIKAELEDYYEGEVNHGRLYPNLDDLVEHGYVEKGQIDRRTNSYELTDIGAEALSKRREWENSYLGDPELAIT